MEKTRIIPFWKWFWVTALGLVVGIGVVILLAMINPRSSESAEADGVVGLGFTVGAFQYFVLRKKYNIPKQWVWSSTISVLIAIWVFDQIRHYGDCMWPDGKSESDGVKICIGFVSMAVGQALLLKTSGYRKWFLFALSGATSYMLFYATVLLLNMIGNFFKVNDNILVVFVVPTILFSYPLCNTIVFTFIQKQTFSEYLEETAKDDETKIE